MCDHENSRQETRTKPIRTASSTPGPTRASIPLDPEGVQDPQLFVKNAQRLLKSMEADLPHPFRLSVRSGRTPEVQPTAGFRY